MGVFYEDTKSRFLREGKIEGKIEAVISFIEKEGYSLEKAVDIIADDDNREIITEGVKRKLSG